jgi:methylated-DNA-[protein]-cysteine S-methyltransferase
MKTMPWFDPNLAAWLRDDPSSHRSEPMTAALDDLFAAGPSPAALARAQDKLRRALASTRPPVAYFDDLPRTLVGRLFVAVTEQGVISVGFSPSERDFIRRLQARTCATVVRSPEKTAEARRQLRDYLAGTISRFDLPIDLRAVTDFQRGVLLAAAEVPRGQVATYAEIARRIGRPRAARAVGQALGHNPIPIIIPCHRILASDGTLGGYSARDGLKTKARLLRLEGALS